MTDAPRIVTDYLNERSIRGNQGCGQTINKRDRTYHESELCQFRKLKCHTCGEISKMMVGMEKKVADHVAKIAFTDTKLENMDTKLNKMDAKLNIMDTKLANIDVNEKLNKMEANIGTKMAQTDTKLEIMNTNIANLQENVEARFEAVNNEMRGMNMSLNEMKDGFDHLKEAVLGKIESKERKQEEITRDVSGSATGGKENQHIFVAGGAGRNSVEIFNYPQRLWSLLKSMPRTRYRATSFVYNNHVTLAGGWCGGPVDNMIRMNIYPVLDLSIDWSDFAARLPVRMHTCSNVVYKDSLLVTGGCNEDQHVYSDCIHEVELKPPYTVKLLSKMP